MIVSTRFNISWFSKLLIMSLWPMISNEFSKKSIIIYFSELSIWFFSKCSIILVNYYEIFSEFSDDKISSEFLFPI